MGEVKIINPIEAAEMFVNMFYPDCNGALLAGSVVRGEATETSDLDIIVFDSQIDSSYRESTIKFGWPIELFVHNLNSYKSFFKSDCERARPSLPRMVSEGIVLKDNGIISSIKIEASELLENGPEEWSSDTIRIKRYFITDTLDDFIVSKKRSEEIFIAGTLADIVSEFVLRTNKKWIGTSKWIVRSLKEHDKEFANRFVQAFDSYYKTGEKHKVIQIVDSVLEPHGGRLFEGFSLGKKNI
ncbi:nucleotidyltransferase domain-containing protein [Cytobacillus suaedae]|nr:nucleotidyltransferase domain-containing protein [Cytobacillus suaedae]